VAPVTPPSYLQAGSYSARSQRLMLAGLTTGDPTAGPLATRQGVTPYPIGGMQVVQRSTPDRWVTVWPGTVYIQAASATGGVYACVNDANFDVLTATSHATLARKDLVIARVKDAVDYIGSDNQYDIEVITGTPASSPTRPATPVQALALAEINIPAASSTVITANIVDLRQVTVASGGVLPCLGAADVPAFPYAGMKIYRLDLQADLTWDGTAWRSMPHGSWTTYTPIWTATAGTTTLGNGTLAGRYTQIGKTVHFKIRLTWGTTTTQSIATENWRFSLPVAPYAGQGSVWSLAEAWALDSSASTRYVAHCYVSNTALVESFVSHGSSGFFDASTPFAWANTDRLNISGTYEAA
jgi:hypothetical protein